MRQMARIAVVCSLLALCFIVMPTPAHADTGFGSTIVNRFWESMLSTFRNRTETNAPTTVKLLQEAENIFLGGTEDVTNLQAIRDVYAAMRSAGLLLLALCTVISLAELMETSMMGPSTSLTDWFRRFCIATFMTMGSIHFYSFWIRIFNGLLAGFRQYLDSHWTGATDSSALFTQLIPLMNGTNTLLLFIFILVALVLLLVLWFLIGGIRTAELALAVVIAPLVWPLYLVPSVEDVPKTAFRMFLGLNASLLIVVAMLRMAVRMVAGGALATTVWNFVPSLALLTLAVFLPSMIKRLVGQGHTGTGFLTTVAYTLAGMKGLSLAIGGGGAAGAAAHPPATAAIPQSPSGASAYPVAPVPQNGVSSAPTTPPIQEMWVTAPTQLAEGQNAARSPALGAPPASGSTVLTMGQSEPGSNKWDVVAAWAAYDEGLRAAPPKRIN